ncbi:hypothetical protein NL676_013790 [Syzygium grande]|nr:hypothetical protein NL676_013790 [Syzygium grande]
MANLLCLVIQFLVFFLLLIGRAHSVSFNFSGFHPNTGNLMFEGDAFTSDGVIQLTRNQQDRTLERSAGRASYDKPVRLWDSKTGRLTDFMAHFTFLMKALNDTYYGDGITFYIAPFDAVIPANSSGGYLALFNESTANDTSANCVVAIEFDSFQNDWDPSPDHVGINVNSIVSATNVSWRTSMKNGSIANAWVSYNSTSFNLSVFLTYVNDPVFSNNSSLSYIIDLREILPEQFNLGGWQKEKKPWLGARHTPKFLSGSMCTRNWLVHLLEEEISA